MHYAVWPRARYTKQKPEITQRIFLWWLEEIIALRKMWWDARSRPTNLCILPLLAYLYRNASLVSLSCMFAYEARTGTGTITPPPWAEICYILYETFLHLTILSLFNQYNNEIMKLYNPAELRSTWERRCTQLVLPVIIASASISFVAAFCTTTTHAWVSCRRRATVQMRTRWSDSFQSMEDKNTSICPNRSSRPKSWSTWTLQSTLGYRALSHDHS